TTTVNDSSTGEVLVMTDGGAPSLHVSVDSLSPTQSFGPDSARAMAYVPAGVFQYVVQGHDHPITLGHSGNEPQGVSQSAFDGLSTISRGSGVVKGYGKAHSAAELDQNGQMIADGHGQERTLDLSAVGVIKNSVDNPHSGHNGWFAQTKGKLVLPAVAFNNGQATRCETSVDSPLDL